MNRRRQHALCVPGLAMLICAGLFPVPGATQEIGTSILPPVDRGAAASESPAQDELNRNGADVQAANAGEARRMPPQDEAGADGTTVSPTGMKSDADGTSERAHEVDANPAPNAAQDASEETAQRPNAPDDPLFDLRGRWRMAVRSGKTELGFPAWAEAWLVEDPEQKKSGIPSDPAPEPGPINGPVKGPVNGTVQAGRTRMASERWRARSGPVAMGHAGRVVTTFGSAIPTAFCSPFMVCYIELEPGEVLTDTPSWGDTIRWQLITKTQGRDPETLSIEVKPSLDAELTNLVIPTDRRLYTINLVNDPDIHTPILSFHYPDSAMRAIAEKIEADRARETERRAAADAARAKQIARTGVRTSTGSRPASELDFDFRVTGNARFKPVRVYTDGHRTFIDLHPDYRGELPTILPGAGEANKALNTRVTGNGTRLEADRVIADVYLQAGKQRVRIRRTGS